MNMLKNLLILAFVAVSVTLFSQTKGEFAPLNPDFTNYCKSQDINHQKSSTSDNTQLPGIIPMPFTFGEIELDSKEIHQKSLNSGLPAYFDLRNVDGKSNITSVKYQGSGANGGNCWTFATMGSIESSWILKGLFSDTLDLSEQNIASCHGYAWKYGDGGNSQIALA